MPSVAVLGGGISGLCAAYRLQDLAGEHDVALDVTIFEREPLLGGCVQTLRENGFVMELGADSLLIDKPPARSLLRRLDLENEIVEQQEAFKGARIVRKGTLRSIPGDFRLFAPRSIPALLRSGIFSIPGIARAAMEPFVPPKRSGGDESLASFVTRRLGREVLDRLAQPIVGGMYSADPAHLSMQAALPQFVQYEQRYGSLLRALRHANARSQQTRLVALRDGLGRIVEALASRLRANIQTSAPVTAITRDKSGWRIDVEGGAHVRADAVVAALPAPQLARVLAAADAVLAQSLSAIRCNSIATVNLQYAREDARDLPPATGFVVPQIEGRQITAATFSSQKYPNRAPQHDVLLRTFIGGAWQGALVERSDEELAAIAVRELRALAGVISQPRRAIVRRWTQALPQYDVGHTERVAGLRARAAMSPGLSLAGCAYGGVGIPDCVASGEAAAESVFGYIRGNSSNT